MTTLITTKHLEQQKSCVLLRTAKGDHYWATVMGVEPVTESESRQKLRESLGAEQQINVTLHFADRPGVVLIAATESTEWELRTRKSSATLFEIESVK